MSIRIYSFKLLYLAISLPGQKPKAHARVPLGGAAQQLYSPQV